MAKISNRIPLYSAQTLIFSEDQRPMRWITARRAIAMKIEKKVRLWCTECSGAYIKSSTCRKSTNKTHHLIAQLVHPTKPRHSATDLTMSDMVQNAAAVVDHYRCRARTKVEQWPEVHDTHAVTVVAGRGVFVPDARAAARRAVARAREACRC